MRARRFNQGSLSNSHLMLSTALQARSRGFTGPVDVRIDAILKAPPVIIAAASAVLLAGCPAHRQGARLIYVPAPPAAAAQGSSAQGGVLEIPAPPPAVQVEQPKKPEEAIESAPPPRPAQRRRPPHDRAQETVPDSATSPAAAAEVPPPGAPELAPARSRAQQAELEKHIGDLKGAIRERIAALSRRHLSSADLKALEDARNFLSQADQASRQGDMQQSLNLAQKADLLVSAIEKRY